MAQPTKKNRKPAIAGPFHVNEARRQLWRGLSLLGLSEGQEFTVTNAEGKEERILLHQVLY